MARSIPVDLGHRLFPHKTAAQKYFRDAIHQRAVGDEITVEDALFRDIASLLERHPERDQKIGVGVAAFIVRLDDNDNRMLWLRRSDGSESDFSYVTCVRGTGMTLDAEFAGAARVAVRFDIERFKMEYFVNHADSSGRAPCQETGKLITIEESQVDHHPLTFDMLLRQFRSEHQVTPSREILSAPADNQKFTSFSCQRTKDLFVNYHRARGTLMVVHKQVNLSRKRSWTNDSPC